MRKSVGYLLLVVSVSLLLARPSARAAFDDVTTVDNAVSIVLPGSGKVYTVDPSTKVESFTVNDDDSIDFRVTTGSVVLLQSADKSTFITSGDSTCATIVSVCGANFSSLSVRCSNPMGDNGPHTLKVTPTGTCTPPDRGGNQVVVVAEQSSGGGGGGNHIVPSNPAAPTIKTPTVRPVPSPATSAVKTPTKTLPSSLPTKKTTPRLKVTLYLKPGIKGATAVKQVTELQLRLQKLGYFPAKTKPNGVYGPATIEAVKKFQKAKGIKETYLGPKTRDVLNK